MTNSLDRDIHLTADGYQVDYTTEDNQQRSETFDHLWEARQFVADELR